MEPNSSAFERVDFVVGMSGATAPEQRGGAGLGDLFASLRRPKSSRADQRELIASLNEVADAVSSALEIGDVLDIIVERAKRVTDTDKAVLALADEHGEHLDVDTIVVRGRRRQHPQEWWQERLLELEDHVFDSHEIVVETHPEHNAILVRSPVRVKDHPIGVICAINSADRAFTPVQIDFLAILSAFAAAAIENARLAEQSHYVMLASERDRIAREMHDGVVQSLFSISLGLEICKKQVFRDPQATLQRLDELQEHLNSSMTELRRFIYDLRPVKLAEFGLTGAIEYWIQQVTAGKNTKGRLVVVGELPRLQPAQEACLYRVAKESVSNVVKHAKAERFEVRIESEADSVRLTISDDGQGFDVDEIVGQGATSGIGLQSIRERVQREGGTLELSSTPGQGTTISVELQAEVA